MTHNEKRAQRGQITGLQVARRQKACREFQPTPLLQEAPQSLTLPSPPSLLLKSQSIQLLSPLASLRAQRQQWGTLVPSTPDLLLHSGPHCQGSLKGISRTGWCGTVYSWALLSAARRGWRSSTSAADSDLVVTGQSVQTTAVASLTCISCPRAASSQWGCRACGAPGRAVTRLGTTLMDHPLAGAPS